MISTRFFIAALPRSRTAWLSQFFCAGDVFCLHDGLNRYPNKESLSRAMSGTHRAYGNADSGLMFSQFQDWFDAPTLVIERDEGEVYESLVDLFGSAEWALVREMSDRLKKVTGLRIPYSEINDRLEEIWSYCVGDGYDHLRGESMKRMKIETTEIHGNPESFREVASWLGYTRV